MSTTASPQSEPSTSARMANGPTPPRRSETSVRLGPAAVTGALVGTLEILIAISLGGLLFAGPLAPHAGTGIGLAMFGALVVLALVTWRSSLPGTLGSVQDVTAAALVVVVGGVVAQLGPTHPGLVGTVVAAIALTTALTGAGLWLLGRFRLGQLARFVPYPVVGGFLAGTGWLLLLGGLSLLADPFGELAAASTWTDPAFLAVASPGVVLAVALLVGVRRGATTSFVPLVCVAAIVGGYLFVVLGPGFTGAQADGWFLGPFPDGGLWPPDAALLGAVDVWAVLAQAPAMLTIVLLSAIALLLNASGIELMLHRDADLDRELRVAGGANLVAAAGGGLPGFHALSLTNLAKQSGTATPAVGWIAAGIVAAALIFGGDVAGLVPRAVVGGLLVFLGLAFLTEWLLDGWRTLLRSDYAIVVLIVLVIATVGFLAGVAVGVVATTVLFLVTYSRADVVRHAFDGNSYQSRVDRPADERAQLTELGPSIAVLELQGFLFFGTAVRLVDRIGERLRDAEAPLRYLVLDLRRVTGLDSSTVMSFQRAAQLASQHDVTVVLTGLRGRVERQLERSELARTERVVIAPELDRAVQLCEDELLHSDAAQMPPAVDLVDLLAEGLGSRALGERLAAHVTDVTVPAGQLVIRQGDDTRDVMFLRSGRITVTLESPDGETRRLRTMQPGTIVGEVSMYLGTPRSAHVRAETDAVLGVLPFATVSRLAHEDPELAAALHGLLAHLLATRLAATLRTLEAMDD